MTSLQVAPADTLEKVLLLAAGPSQATRGPPGGSRAHPSYLAPDVRAWFASPEQGLRAATESVSGAGATVDALARLAPSHLTVIETARSKRACWAEIVRHSDAGPETCLAKLSYGPGGGVSRLVLLRAPLVPRARPDAVETRRRPGADAVEAAPAGRPILERYFADLMSSRFHEAASRFSVDTLYSHPPYASGTERVLFQGREALGHGFVEMRGPSPARQIIIDFWQRDDRVFVEGVIEGIPDGGTFFSTGRITPQGEIARYVAFYSADRIPGD